MFEWFFGFSLLLLCVLEKCWEQEENPLSQNLVNKITILGNIVSRKRRFEFDNEVSTIGGKKKCDSVINSREVGEKDKRLVALHEIMVEILLYTINATNI